MIKTTKNNKSEKTSIPHGYGPHEFIKSTDIEIKVITNIINEKSNFLMSSFFAYFEIPVIDRNPFDIPFKSYYNA